jgi:hypothetical protein
MLSCYVIQTKPKKEEVAALNLLNYDAKVELHYSQVEKIPNKRLYKKRS